ncbi:RNA polymerase II transcription elongation factor SpEAF [Elasticomyces elasticus]|uniref:Vacuolar import and degradation protein 21 n=1 Tax=Exophiala sideris TaxID=1016849 RepID=A0ABR0J7P7_9EURO|nr:RNA polymerase II transcription elongation factor SpEAF [Elasticomyces elasticus]KAK5029564.1 RNA polymerase II transcription elongation factor SpEAF [Exophiala sideris]KAK5058193.1 RNA polymerase II transcription elongation factor SpEAF [Exophiala sideris]KAK5182153.1 RNA polymerase II transcription elongation factor SpEAF [Eurotiomycetes sp. CCFEE 6388]
MSNYRDCSTTFARDYSLSCRGRLFDESTLPSRTHILLQARPLKADQQTTSSIPDTQSPPRITSDSEHDDSLERALKNTEKHVSSEQPAHLDEGDNADGAIQSALLLADQAEADAQRDYESVAEDVHHVEESAAVTALKDYTVPKAVKPPGTSVLSTEGKVSEVKLSDTQVGVDAAIANIDSGATAALQQARRSPPVLAPNPGNVDPQSSPASTNEPDSANTPVLTAASPVTSPGLDLPPSTDELTHEGKPSNISPVDPETLFHDANGLRQEATAEQQSPLEDVAMTGTENAEQDVVASSDQGAQRPSVRIDTQTDIESYFKPRLSTGIVESPAQMTAVGTPKRALPVTPSTQEPPKRATRISSGVLQKKSVSEILGETPKAMTPQGESPVSTPGGRGDVHDRRSKERSRLSTVVFAKPQKATTDESALALERIDNRQVQKASNGERDYLYTLFENKAHSMSRQTSMTYLIQNAHKTLSTSDHLVEYELAAECRILKRLYQLQEKQRWPLRQYKRADEAPRPTSHWDFVLDHMRWMRTDFREERKWKLAAARNLAECCAEWVASSPEGRASLQVQIRPPRLLPKPVESQDVDMDDVAGPTASSQPTPELMPSNEEDSMSDDIADPREVRAAIAPATLFSLGASDFSFAADHTPALDKLLNELPLYEPSVIEPDLSTSNLAQRLDAQWKTPIVPVSRWATEKLPVKDYRPPFKRSRYEYEVEPSSRKTSDILPPEETNVALFMPENKHIRDRIHPGHSFRPPSEHPMPTQAFFETRSSSQWTHTEDDELRRLVKDYSYNWSLISSCLTPRGSYTSGADRRTPWECFERWIGLEGLPADMSKTAYFKTYSGRIEAAGRHVAAQIEEAQRRAGANVQIPARKRTTQPIRVERKRTQRHLAMLDAMRKLAKKRETALQKQQHQADLAAMRKVNDANVPKPTYKTPAEFSQLKQEREAKLAERQEIYRQQLIAHQRATAQQQRGQNPAPNGVPNGMPPGAPGMRGPPSAGGMSGMPNGNLQVPNGHPRHPAMMAMQGNMQLPPGMVAPKGLTPQMQAQMQAQMAARGNATSPQQMRILQEASRVQQEQLMRQAQQAQNGVHSSPNNPHAALAAGKGMNNATYMSAMANANGVGSPSALMNGASASPRPATANSGQALSSGHVPVLTQIANKIREHHPNLSEEEVNRLASQQITQYQQQATAAAAGHTQKRPQPHNQAALNAAIGAVNAGNAAAAQFGHAAGGMMTNEQIQQYNQRMRMQQAQQHAVRGMQGQMQPGVMGAIPNGMNNSPVMNMARPVSQHANQGQMSRSATPRDQRSSSQSNVNGNASGPQSSPRPAQQSMQT